MCTCFAFYVVGAAQEYGWDEYIRLCATNVGQEAHATIILCRPMVVEPREATENDLFELKLWEKINDSKMFKLNLGDELLFPRVEAKIEMSYDEGIAVGLTIRSESSREEWNKYIDEFNENRVVIYPKRQIVADDVICWYPANSKWNVIAQLVKSNAVHKANFFSGLRRFVLLGAMFRFEDVTDLMLRRIAVELELRKLQGKVSAATIERLGLDYPGERVVDVSDFKITLEDEWRDLGVEIVKRLTDKIGDQPEHTLLVARIALADSLFWKAHET
jgi:hypothetical protein